MKPHESSRGGMNYSQASALPLVIADHFLPKLPKTIGEISGISSQVCLCKIHEHFSHRIRRKHCGSCISNVSNAIGTRRGLTRNAL